jgi:hypothetical protein
VLRGPEHLVEIVDLTAESEAGVCGATGSRPMSDETTGVEPVRSERSER